MASLFTRIFYIVAYLAISFISLTALMLFRPFTYIENNESYLICKDGSRFDLASNSIFAFTESLDAFNDKKARKLCQYKIIRDYYDTYQTPNEKNYTFFPIYVNESSWLTAIFVFTIVFTFGTMVILFIGNKFFHRESLPVLTIVIVSLTTVAFYLTFLRKSINELYCEREVEIKIYNFKRSIRKNGFLENPLDMENVRKIAPNLYKACLQN